MRNKRGYIRYAVVLSLAVAGLMIRMTPFLTSSGLAAPNVPSEGPTATLSANGKIAFTSDRDGNREIYVMNQDGTDQVRLTNNTIVDDHPTWSPDGLKIAFVSERTTGGRAIFTMNPDGTGRTEVTSVSYVDRYTQWPYWIWTDFYSMDWSPDGTRIVFQDNYDLVIVNADGSNRHAITDGTSYDLEPAWSPDGSKIVFSRDPINDGGLQYGRLSTVNIDGSNIQFLSGWQGQAYAPKWAPSGDKILYVIEYTDFDPTSVINISNADGSAAQIFDGRTDVYEYQYRNKPSWSPDGMKILFDKLVYETGYPGDLEIYVKNIEGTGFTQLTNTNGWNFNPSWQPLAHAACPNPINCADFFVRQQYLDFLNREPDTAGFNDWLNVLNGCGSNQGGLGSPPECDRVHVSSGFFRSTEFGERGYWIYRFYESALGRRPTLVEFLPESHGLSGLMTSAELEARRAAFINRFMQLPEFNANFNGLTDAGHAAQFVAKLEQVARVNLLASATTEPGQPPQFDRQQLIDLMSSGQFTAGQTMRAFIEQKVVWDTYFYRAFVAMQYFGYLRRDPEAAGYNDWVRVLTFGDAPTGIQPGDYRHLIFGFIYSVEYRERFGKP